MSLSVIDYHLALIRCILLLEVPNQVLHIMGALRGHGPRSLAFSSLVILQAYGP